MANTDNFNTVTVGNTATLIMAANVDRHSFLINNTSAQTIYVGPTSSVTAANGISILENGSLAEDSSGTKLYQSDVYGITAAATADVRYWERIRGAT